MAAEQRLKEDLVRIACWIEASHPECLSVLEVKRHYSCEDNEIAYVVPLVKYQATRRLIRGEAEAAFRALGWTIRPEGRDVRSIFGRHKAGRNTNASRRFRKSRRSCGTLRWRQPRIRTHGGRMSEFVAVMIVLFLSGSAFLASLLCLRRPDRPSRSYDIDEIVKNAPLHRLAEFKVRLPRDEHLPRIRALSARRSSQVAPQGPHGPCVWH